MRITILTIGSRGDVEPYVALGMGLQSAGHDVQLATHDYFESFVRSRGLGFFPTAGDPRRMLESEAGRKWLETHKNPIAFMRRMVEAAKPAMRQILDDCWRACQNTDLILFQVLAALPAASLAEKLSIPAFPAYLQHVHPTRFYPSTLSAPHPRLGGTYNRLTYPVTELLYWQFMRPLINQWRRQTLDLPPYPLRGPFRKWLRQRVMCLYGFSPSVIPKPPDWGDEIHITGYWFLEKAGGWQPPADLADFLQSGPPPVFVGFGSMTTRNPEELTDMVMKALARSGQRGILLTGWGGLSNADLPDNMFKIEAAPFDWLFPRMAAVVHHGGAGTTATGLRAGVPSIVVPFFADQHFWAWRVSQLSVGPQPVPHKKLSVDRLAAAIKEATSNKEMQRRAAELGKRIQAEDGVGEAVAVLNRHLAQQAGPMIGR